MSLSVGQPASGEPLTQTDGRIRPERSADLIHMKVWGWDDPRVHQNFYWWLSDHVLYLPLVFPSSLLPGLLAAFMILSSSLSTRSVWWVTFGCWGAYLLCLKLLHPWTNPDPDSATLILTPWSSHSPFAFTLIDFGHFRACAHWFPLSCNLCTYHHHICVHLKD